MPEVPLNFDMLPAFIGAVIGSVVTLLFRWVLHRTDLRRKKRLMNEDLIHQQEVLQEYKRVTEKLLLEFKNREQLERKSHPSFEDLYTDIYDALSKADLFLLYQRRLPQIVKVYKTIVFLKEFRPSKIYGDYVTDWDTHKQLPEHLEHMKKIPQGAYCGAQAGYVVQAIGQLTLNVQTIDDLRRDINSALKIKFYWLNPFWSLSLPPVGPGRDVVQDAFEVPDVEITVN